MPPFAQINDLWYALPPIVVVSLVYAASRHEDAGPLLRHAVRAALWIIGFMAAIFVVLELLLRAV